MCWSAWSVRDLPRGSQHGRSSHAAGRLREGASSWNVPNEGAGRPVLTSLRSRYRGGREAGVPSEQPTQGEAYLHVSLSHPALVVQGPHTATTTHGSIADSAAEVSVRRAKPVPPSAGRGVPRLYSAGLTRDGRRTAVSASRRSLPAAG